MFHVQEFSRVTQHPIYGKMDSTLGNNGVFSFIIHGLRVLCIVSDGGGWEHVSVSTPKQKKCPSWKIMCRVKDLFWNDEDTVIQFHPAKDNYINNHPYCLHLWRPIAEKLPLPNPEFVGIKS